MSKSSVNSVVMDPSDERWMDLVAEAPGANTFHHPAWSQVLAEAYGRHPLIAAYRPFVVAMTDESGAIRAGLPVMEVASRLTGRRWIALPFTDHCDPLTSENEGLQAKSEKQAWRRALIRSLAMLLEEEGIRSLELRTPVPSAADPPAEDQAEDSGEGASTGLGVDPSTGLPVDVHRDEGQVLHRLRLSPDPDEVYDRFHRSQVQRNITRAERDGVEVRWGAGRKDLDLFYELHVETRRRLGVPVQPKRYFDLLHERVLNAGMGFLLLAHTSEVGAARPIAGALFLCYRGATSPTPAEISNGEGPVLIYKYGASDSEHWSLRPNHALFWTAIKWGCENGYRVFDWGKTAVDNAGLRHFKGHWGAEESPLAYSVLSAGPALGQGGEGGGMSGLPESVSDVMETIIQHSPKFVCRTLGEMFYKHFA